MTWYFRHQYIDRKTVVKRVIKSSSVGMQFIIRKSRKNNKKGNFERKLGNFSCKSKYNKRTQSYIKWGRNRLNYLYFLLNQSAVCKCTIAQRLVMLEQRHCTQSVLRIFVHFHFLSFFLSKSCIAIFFVKLQHSLVYFCHLTIFC